jgi:hypothetical protein
VTCDRGMGNDSEVNRSVEVEGVGKPGKLVPATQIRFLTGALAGVRVKESFGLCPRRLSALSALLSSLRISCHFRTVVRNRGGHMLVHTGFLTQLVGRTWRDHSLSADRRVCQRRDSVVCGRL